MTGWLAGCVELAWLRRGRWWWWWWWKGRGHLYVFKVSFSLRRYAMFCSGLVGSGSARAQGAIIARQGRDSESEARHWGGRGCEGRAAPKRANRNGALHTPSVSPRPRILSLLSRRPPLGRFCLELRYTRNLLESVNGMRNAFHRILARRSDQEVATGAQLDALARALAVMASASAFSRLPLQTGLEPYS